MSTHLRCHSYTPGHRVHWIHFRRMVEMDYWVDVEVHVDRDLELIHLIREGKQQLLWFHDVAALAAALEIAVDAPQWCPRYSTLMVPGGFQGPTGSSFFYLARLDRVHPCLPPSRKPSGEDSVRAGD